MIRFPTEPMARRVSQRILKMAAKVDPVAREGAVLDRALAQPVPEVAAPVGVDEALLYKALGL